MSEGDSHFVAAYHTVLIYCLPVVVPFDGYGSCMPTTTPAFTTAPATLVLPPPPRCFYYLPPAGLVMLVDALPPLARFARAAYHLPAVLPSLLPGYHFALPAFPIAFHQHVLPSATITTTVGLTYT